MENKIIKFKLKSGIATKDFEITLKNGEYTLNICAYGDWWDETFTNIDDLKKYLKTEWHVEDFSFLEQEKKSLNDDFEADFLNGDAVAAAEIFDKLQADNKKIKKITLKFKGIDSWNRPVFKYNKKFYGDTDNLFDYDATVYQVLKFYEENPEKIKNITYFGERFGCEPSGLPLQSDLKIVLE